MIKRLFTRESVAMQKYSKEGGWDSFTIEAGTYWMANVMGEEIKLISISKEGLELFTCATKEEYALAFKEVGERTEEQLEQIAKDMGVKRIKYLMMSLMDEGLKVMMEKSSVTREETDVLILLIKNTKKEVEEMRL